MLRIKSTLIDRKCWRPFLFLLFFSFFFFVLAILQVYVGLNLWQILNTWGIRSEWRWMYSNRPSVRYYHLDFVLWVTYYFLWAADWATTNFLLIFLIKSVPGHSIVESQHRLVGYYRFKSAFLHFKTIFLLKNWYL